MKQRLFEMWGRLPLPYKLRYWLARLGVAGFPVGVAAVIPDDEGRILMFRHTYRGRYPWGLPSGWLEAGEQPDRAVAREILEEAGLEVEGVRILHVHSAPDVRRIDMVFTGRLVGGTFRPSPEVTEMRWFARDELPEMLESQRLLLQKTLRVLDQQF